jgi:WD repeat and SOF domain-containing protein 1
VLACCPNSIYGCHPQNTDPNFYKAHISHYDILVIGHLLAPKFVSGVGGTAPYVYGRKAVVHNPEVYHTSACSTCSQLLSTTDVHFMLSGSDDGNMHVWKVNASEKLGIITACKCSVIKYWDALKEQWKINAKISKVQWCIALID